MDSCISPLFVRTDVARDIGMGHFMRCFALAQHWRDRGGNVTFIGQHPESMRRLLTTEEIASVDISRRHPCQQDLETTLSIVPAGAVVAIDGYHFDAPYQSAVSDIHRVLMIDDTGHQPEYFGDVLLNQNLHASTISYASAPEQRLLGPTYALLRREFRQYCGRNSQRRNDVRRLMVCLGGADLRGDTLQVLAAIKPLEAPGLEVKVIIGALNPHRTALTAFTRSLPWISLVESPSSMAAEMVQADMAVTNAGSICWELAALGLPSVLLAASDNQVPVGLALDSAGAAIYAGQIESIDTATLTDIIDRVLRDQEGRAQVSSKAAQLVDGDGVVRVSKALEW